MINFPTSKLPDVGTSIFSVMSALASEQQAFNLSQGFPDFNCPEPLMQLVTRSVRKQRKCMVTYLILTQK
jgi:methionine transaminase